MSFLFYQHSIDLWKRIQKLINIMVVLFLMFIPDFREYTMSWGLWKHPNPVPGGRPTFFKPEWSKKFKNGFKTIRYRRYRMVIFSNYFFWYQKSSKKLDSITSNSHCSRITCYPSFISQDFFHFSTFIRDEDNLNM